MQDIARELHISSRTLQRRLQDAGYSFQQVLEEARHQLSQTHARRGLLARLFGGGEEEASPASHPQV